MVKGFLFSLRRAAGCLLFWGMFFFPPCVLADTGNSSTAVILAYHRIGEDYFPQENLRQDQFVDQIDELVSNGYAVLPLERVLSTLETRGTLPPKAVVITFEGGYRSVLDNAIPLLIKHKLPFTVFFASDKARENNDDFLSWEDIDHLKSNPLASFGVLPADYGRLTESSDEEIQTQVNIAKIAYREHFSREPDFFSYPYGEYSMHVEDILRQYGFQAAMGLQSGVAYSGSDLLALPRFSMTEKYGNIDHFRMILNSLPLPVFNVEPDDPYLHSARPSIGFSVAPDIEQDLSRLSCFVSSQARPDIERIGDNRVEIRLAKPISEPRTRVNCTMPVKKDDQDDDSAQRWRWLGFLFTLAPQ